MSSPRQIGRYEIIDELGRGGMAIVYRAFDPQFEREVAIKVLPREFLFDAGFRQRFEREARTIARLEHYAIVPVYDFGEHEGQPYLVMRYMPGGSLAERITGGWPVPLEGAIAIVERVGAALDAAHQEGVIHRDVKPGNIMFGRRGQPHLTDFGIVKLTEATAQLTGSGLVGTPAYMAPEMARPGGMTSLVDVYALGVTLYQMLAGELPYEADTPMGLLMAHMGMPIPDIRECCPNLHAGVQGVFERALAKDPADRYQRAGEMAAALRAITASEPVEDRPATRDEVTVAEPASAPSTRITPPEPAPKVATPYPSASRPAQIPVKAEPKPAPEERLGCLRRWWRVGVLLVGGIDYAGVLIAYGYDVYYLQPPVLLLLLLLAIILGVLGVEHVIRHRWLRGSLALALALNWMLLGFIPLPLDRFSVISILSLILLLMAIGWSVVDAIRGEIR